MGQWGVLFIFILVYGPTSQAVLKCRPKSLNDTSCDRVLVKLNPKSAKGVCLPDGTPNNIAELLKRNNIKVSEGLNPKERGPATELQPISNFDDPKIKAVARVVEAYEKINQGNLTLFGGDQPIEIIFAKEGSEAQNSRRYFQQIQLTPGTQNMDGMLHDSTCGGLDNHGLIAHELAHYIANSNERAVEKAYISHMKGGSCDLTKYRIAMMGKSKPNHALTEEIAEGIAAFITNPGLFQNSGSECMKSLEFFKNIFGEPKLEASCLYRQTSYRGSGSPYRLTSEDTILQQRRMPPRGAQPSRH